MSNRPDEEKLRSQDLSPSETAPTSHPFLLADYQAIEPVQVELVNHPVRLEEQPIEALVADSQCEV